MVKRIKVLSLLTMLILSLFLLVGHTTALVALNINDKKGEKFIVTGSNDPQSVIRTMIDAMNSNDIPLYISTFTQDNRAEMEKVYNKNPDAFYFKEKNVRLVNIKKLPAAIGMAAASVSPREGLDPLATEVYYVELSFEVDQQEKWLYNGTNHRVIVMTKENGEWKIVRVSVPSISYIIDKGYGFGTLDEQKAKNIEETMDKKGLVLDNQGKIIKNIAASQE